MADFAVSNISYLKIFKVFYKLKALINGCHVVRFQYSYLQVAIVNYLQFN